MRSQGMMDDGNYRELITWLSTVLVKTEAAYLASRRRHEMWQMVAATFGNSVRRMKSLRT